MNTIGLRVLLPAVLLPTVLLPTVLLPTVLLPTVLLGLSTRVLAAEPAAVAAPVKLTSVNVPAVKLSAADLSAVKRMAFSRQIMFTGTLNPASHTVIGARVGGTVDSVTVQPGDSVRKGQVLLRLNTEELDARVQQAEASLASARAEARVADARAERFSSLSGKQFVSDLDATSVRGEAEARRSMVKAQEAQLTLARKALRDAVIAAPMTGMVAERFVEPGSRVMPDARLFSVVDLSQMELVASVTAGEIPAVRVGQKAGFQVEGFADRSFVGTVVRINPVANAGSRSINVYLRVSNGDRALKGGMFARGSIAGGASAAAGSLVIPASALHSVNGRTQVFVVRSQRVQLQAVTVGERDPASGNVAISSGLAEGEVVILPALSPGVVGSKAEIAQPVVAKRKA